MPTFTASRLTSICEDLFLKAGASAENASCVVEHMVLSNLLGHDSHGVFLIPFYLEAIRKGDLAPAAAPETIRDEGTTAVVDGNQTFGHVAAHFATRLAIRKAQDQKIGLVGVVRHHHIGRLGHFAEMAAAQGVIGLIATGGFGSGGRSVVAHGGLGRTLGANPLALGFPGGERNPVIIDMATSAVAIGKVAVARDKGKELPEGCIIDKRGQPSVDPNDYFDGGAALPFAAHKGAALALAVELMGGALVGAEDYLGREEDRSLFGPAGTLIAGIDQGALRASESYGASATEIIQRIQESEPAQGVQRVMVAGEPEMMTRAERVEQGIPIPERSWDEVCKAAQEWGVELPSK
jgi:LDH2 family malate/lactate/ureidoglycolate dehydrogenase